MCETCSELKNTLTQRHLEKLSMFYAISNTIFLYIGAVSTHVLNFYVHIK